jgi:hypothetical protein
MANVFNHIQHKKSSGHPARLNLTECPEGEAVKLTEK